MTAQMWLSTSLKRQFPRSNASATHALIIPAARGERVSFQACLRVDGVEPIEAEVLATSPDGLRVHVRRVGLVPMPRHNTETSPEELDGAGHVPGYVPDPLYTDAVALIPPGVTNAWWISVYVPRAIDPGPKRITLEYHLAGRKAKTAEAAVQASDVVLARRSDLHVTHWFYADALCDWYGVEPFDRRFWPICRTYMVDYAAHGLDTIYVPVFTPPLDGVKRPTQLLDVRRTGRDRYIFGWRQVKRWIDLARTCGIRYFEWTHLFTQWGCEHAIRIYEKRDGADCPLWRPSTGATSPTYRRFLEQFLPALHRFLAAEKLLRRSYFHVSDEPHGDEHLVNYRKARAMLKDIAPWMKVMDALSEIQYGREGLADIPIPSIYVTKQYAYEGIPSWTYFCCGPRGPYLQRLLDTPLAKVRMAGWLFYRFGVGGFLHWGYNYWYKRQTRQLIDPFTVTDGLGWPDWAHGDTFQVYPGPNGPIDSIRWEVFAESLQDYALLQTLGVDPTGPVLSELKDFHIFPKDERWLLDTRARLLADQDAPARRRGK